MVEKYFHCDKKSVLHSGKRQVKNFILLINKIQSAEKVALYLSAHLLKIEHGRHLNYEFFCSVIIIKDCSFFLNL